MAVSSVQCILTVPVVLLQVISTFYVFQRIQSNSRFWVNDNYSDFRNMAWYVAHVLLCVGQQTIWGFPLVRAIKSSPRFSKMLSLVYLASAVVTGIITAVPLIPLTKQRHILGWGVYSSSALYVILFIPYLIYLLLSVSQAEKPTNPYKKTLWRSYVGKMEGFQWFSCFQLALFFPRLMFKEASVLNGFFNWFILLWHVVLAFYFGSHKPRWETATGRFKVD